MSKRAQKIYPVTSGELWSLALFGWLAIPLVLLIRRETSFDGERDDL